MNEQIKQLAEQAGAGQHEGYEVLYHTFSPIALQKFAESLIKKCASVCEEHRQMYGSLAATDATFAAMTTAAGVCGDSIKKHFGVEE